MKKIYIILLMLITSNIFSQVANWNEAVANKNMECVFKSTINWTLPTNNAFEVGYFIYDISDQYICVGKKDITIGSDFSVLVNYDNTGNLGYEEGERLITLLRDKVTLKNYFVEFTYENNANTYTNFSKSNISGIRIGTWQMFDNKPHTFCQNNENIVLQVPYGLRYVLSTNTTSGKYTIQENGDITLFISKSEPKDYTVKLALYSNWNMANDTYAYSVLAIPQSQSFHEFYTCPEEFVTIPTTVDTYERNLINNSDSYQLNQEGTYYYLIANQQCSIQDTVVLKYKTDCNQFVFYEFKSVINPNNGDKLQFLSGTRRKVYNQSMQLLIEFVPPFEWDGRDNSGNLLPVGLYYIVDEHNITDNITIIH